MTSSIPADILAMAAMTGQPRGEVLDFSATWCGPCQQMAPIVSKLEREGYHIRQVDVDSNRALANQFGIRSIPAFVLVVDGQEVRRLVGAVSEEDLLDLLSQIPIDPPVTTASNDARPRFPSVEPASSRTLPAEPDGPASRPPVREGTQPVAVAAQDPGHAPPPINNGKDAPSPGLFGKLFGRGRQDSTPQAPAVVRANVENETPSAANVLPVRNPVEASVRLHVTINGQTQVGSGTVIDSRTGQTLITTCAHLFNGWNDRSKIQVDLFLGGESQTFVGRMIHYDMAADVGLIGIPTDHLVPTAEVGPAAARPQVDEPLVSIGCSGGAAPSLEQLQVTALNYYEGPDNIECTGVPVQGRSGGGLFNRQGQLVGVCIAADADRQRGAYAGLLAVHDLLTASGLSDLYESLPASPPASGSADGTAFAASSVGEPAVPASQSGPDVIPNAQGQTGADLFAGTGRGTSGDMEVICVIRSRQQPEAPSRVVIIDHPSPKFLSYLDGEVAARETPVRTNRVPSTSCPLPAESAQSGTSATRFSIPDDETPPSSLVPREHSRTATLQPTALAQPFRPQRYVRSAHTR
ncbi:MAG: trypsin-like peptidase domain-containing protein [Planctomycetaceae bacterium]